MTINRQYQSAPYKVRTYLWRNMYKRVDGKRVKIHHTEEKYREIIEHAMEMLYDFHIEELDKRGEL